MGFWRQKKVCVTGGAGFVGSYVTELLVDEGAVVTVCDHMRRGSIDRIAHVKDQVRVIEADLSTPEGAEEATRGQEVVMNLAAKVAGIEYSRFHHAEMFTQNIKITSEVMEACARNGVGRVLVSRRLVSIPMTLECQRPSRRAKGGPPNLPMKGTAGRNGWPRTLVATTTPRPT